MTARIIISGIGLITPFANELNQHLNAMWNGQTHFKDISLYSTQDAKIRFAGEITQLSDALQSHKKLQKSLNRKDLLGVAAALRAMDDAKLTQNSYSPERTGAFIATCSTQIGDVLPYTSAVIKCINPQTRDFDSNLFASEVINNINPLTAVKVLMNGCLAHVCQIFNIRGANSNILELQTSSYKALALASDAINRGLIDRALVGSIHAPLDAHTMSQAYRNGYLGAPESLNQTFELIRPFDTAACGTIMSEASVFFVLETEEAWSQRRGAPAYAELNAVSEHTDPMFFLAESQRPLLKQALSKNPRHKSKGPQVIVANNMAVKSRDDLEAKQLQALESSELIICNPHGRLGYTGEACGMLSLVHGMDMLRRQKLMPSFNLTELSQAASGLEINTKELPLSFQQLSTYAINDFGQCAVATISEL